MGRAAEIVASGSQTHISMKASLYTRLLEPEQTCDQIQVNF